LTESAPRRRSVRIVVVAKAHFWRRSIIMSRHRVHQVGVAFPGVNDSHGQHKSHLMSKRSRVPVHAEREPVSSNNRKSDYLQTVCNNKAGVAKRNSDRNKFVGQTNNGRQTTA